MRKTDKFTIIVIVQLHPTKTRMYPSVCARNERCQRIPRHPRRRWLRERRGPHHVRIRREPQDDLAPAPDRRRYGRSQVQDSSRRRVRHQRVRVWRLRQRRVRPGGRLPDQDRRRGQRRTRSTRGSRPGGGRTCRYGNLVAPARPPLQQPGSSPQFLTDTTHHDAFCVVAILFL